MSATCAPSCNAPASWKASNDRECGPASSAAAVVLDGLDPAEVDAEYAADRWRAERLGFDALAGREVLLFDRIIQPWLRDGAKAVSVAVGDGPRLGQRQALALAISRFAQFLAACEPDATNGAVITRPLLERYITWLASTRLAANSRSLSLICPRIPRTQPPPPLASRSPGHGHHLPRRSAGPRPPRPPVGCVGVRDGPISNTTTTWRFSSPRAVI